MSVQWEPETRRGEVIGAGLDFRPVYMRLSVHHYVGCGDVWFCSFSVAGASVLQAHQLGAKDLELAKAEAETLAGGLLDEYRNAFKEATENR